jgi:hypothetical protein
MSTEVSFAKSFLGLLSSRPVQLPEDFMDDPKSYAARTPVRLDAPSQAPRTKTKLTPLRPDP